MLSNKGNFAIDGKEYKAKSLSITYESLAAEDSGRNADGSMHISWIYSNIRKVQIELPPCTASVASEILSKVQGKIYDFTYYDLKENRELTITVYTSNSKGDMYNGIVMNGLYQGIQFSAIEMEGEV